MCYTKYCFSKITKVATFILLLSFSWIQVNAEMKIVTTEFEEKFNDSAANGWTVTNPFQKQLTSICHDFQLFGGFSIFGANATAEKTYDSQVDHRKLYISFQLFTIDSWENEVFEVFIDEELVYSYRVLHTVRTGREIQCGDPKYSDRINTVSFAIPHFRRDFRIRLTSNLGKNASNKSWGIRDLKIIAEFSPSETQLITEEFMQNHFQRNISGWLITGTPVGNKFSQCGKANLFGGYNVFGSKTMTRKQFTNLPAHEGVIVNFDLWLIDGVLLRDTVDIFVDDQIHKFSRPDNHYQDASGMICGTLQISERILHVSIFVPHFRDKLIFSIQGKMIDEKSVQSFGIQNLRILTSSCSSENCKTVAKEFTDKSFSNTNGWQSVLGTGEAVKLETCNNRQFVKGYRAEIFKRFTKLPKHTGVRINFQVLNSGNWLTNMKLTILVNEVEPNFLRVANDFEGQMHCQNNNESTRNYFIDMVHRNDYLEFKILLDGFNKTSAITIENFILVTYDNPEIKIVSSEFTNITFSQVQDWKITGNAGSSPISHCGQQTLFGGFNLFGKQTEVVKQFSHLPPHEYILLTFELYIIDLWEQLIRSDEFTVRIDSEIASVTKSSALKQGPHHICGLSMLKEEPVIVSIYFVHNRDSATVSLQDNLKGQKNEESWGIRNFHLSTGIFDLCDAKDGKCNKNTKD